MTSASKLFFHSKRVHFGDRNNTVEDAEPDSSPAGGNSYRRTSTINRHHHHLKNRHDLDRCNTPPRQIHRHHRSEHKLVHLEQGISQSPSENIMSSENFRNIRRWGETGNDRLPGVVLLARERLVERLRGVNVSESRESSSATSLSALSSDNPLEETVLESWQAVMPTSPTRKTLPRGLDEQMLTQLSINVFNNLEETKGRLSASRECSICLEDFEDGDELINLACLHRFHSSCLFPWVEVCGACPNCRKDIVASS